MIKEKTAWCNILRRKLFFFMFLLMPAAAVSCESSKEDLFKQKPEEEILVQAQEKVLQEPDTRSMSMEHEQKIDSGQDAEENMVKETWNAAEEALQDPVEEPEEVLTEAGGEDVEKAFCYEALTDEIKDRINGKSYGKDCDVPYEELRYVKVLHYGFGGEVHEGELIVNKAIARDIVDIFRELYEERYPIEKMVLVDEYDADDNSSMAADNSSAFNYRVIDGTDRISLHSYGLAVDINPLYNPYVHTVNGETLVTPENGEKYRDRTLDCKYYINKEDSCYKAFTNRGFTWGGDWQNQKDYQHFQKEPE